MKRKSPVILFTLRLLFYYSVLILLSIHPGIAISFDRIGIMQWFIIIPLMAVLAFVLGNRLIHGIKFRTKIPVACYLLPVICLIICSLIAGGFGITSLPPFFLGLASFFLAYFLFHFAALYGPRWGKLSLLEPFLLIWICLKLLAISRSGEEIANQSAHLTQFILIWSLVVFLLHSVVIYLCLFPQSKKGAGKEAAFFLAGALAALLLVLFILPKDFIRNAIVENLNNDRVPELIAEAGDRGLPEGSRQGRRPRDGGREPGLRGRSEDEWQSRTGRGRGQGESEDNMQYMVKIVASEIEPLYMADEYRGSLDPIEGFLISENEPLNELSQQRLFVTWHNTERSFDIGRSQTEIFSLSTLRERYLPYRPITVDPTILHEDAGPLRYIHQVVSNVHAANPLNLVFTPSRRFSASEERNLNQYSEVPLNEEDLELLKSWVDNAKILWRTNRSDYIPDEYEPVNEYLENILALLTAFSEYQYNLNYDDDASIDSLKTFLFETKDGDCVEFSNSLAILGRIAGIPSRVVTGYMVSEGLQTEAHLRGIANLRRQIPFLQQFNFDSLFMVTNLHAHSWTQFYIPSYGWLDFEATSFAIPPIGSGDFNTWDVVIPLINEKKVFSNLRKFPWRAVLRALGWMAAAALVLAYALRYGREAVLYSRAKKPGRNGARALYLLLLAKLAADGKPIKPASKTATEYSELFFNHEPHEHTRTDHFKNFALLYSELRWREYEDKEELNSKYNMLEQEYLNILNNTKRQGIGWWIIRIISLRGLAYL